MEVKSTKSFKNLTGVALESAVIDEISQQIKSNQRIQLRSFEIAKITRNMLKNFSGIYSIDLRSNEIAEIEDETFSENLKLEKIDLMENRMTKITRKLLAGDFSDLQEINLSYNLITSIESGAFDKLSQVESIDLSYNCLKHLHSDLFKKSPELREVYLHDNVIAKVENDLFSSKTDLKILDISRNQLDFVPELEMKKIHRFDLSSNKINLLDLNYEKKKSASIVELVLAFNQISECSELEERRTDILHLDLTGNFIDNMDDFPSFLNLEVLILASNNISDLSLHNFEDRFPSLKIFNIRDNPIECDDYLYVRNTLQSIVFTADASTIHRCHHNSSSTRNVDYLDFDDAIVMELRSGNREMLKQLILNRSLLIIVLSVFVVCAGIAAALFLMQFRFSTMKRKKESLIDQMEL